MRSYVPIIMMEADIPYDGNAPSKISVNEMKTLARSVANVWDVVNQFLRNNIHRLGE
jgi:hypothetical protein